MIKKILEAFNKPSYTAYKLANRYISRYEGFSYKFHKNGEKQLMLKLTRFNPKVVFDVGANVGGWSCLALDYFHQATVHAFELVPETYESLKQNLKKKNAVLNNFGLADKNEKVEYKYYGKDVGVNKIITQSTFHDHRLNFEYRTGEVQRGDDYCADHNIQFIDVLKIDVEGAEGYVLKGFENMLKQGRIKLVQFEYGYSNGDAKFLMKDFYDYLTPYNYIVGPLKPNGVWFREFDYGLNKFSSGPNYVAVLKSKKELIRVIRGTPAKGFPVR